MSRLLRRFSDREGALSKLGDFPNGCGGMTTRAQLVKGTGCLGKKFDVMVGDSVKYSGKFNYGYFDRSDSVSGPMGYYISVSGRKRQVLLRSISGIDLKNRKIFLK